MPLLPISHYRQHQQSECLAACAAMVLDYLQIPFQYNHLIQLLRIGIAGASFRNLRYLKALGVQISIERGDVDILQAHIQRGLAPIVFVATGELPYWDEPTNHAVVAVGIDDGKVYLNDPAFPDAPQVVPIDEFVLAWIEMDEYYALLQS
jgi:ABC-type bacteriocin/lantibiotic exporter with double-glycine peptidase domain